MATKILSHEFMDYYPMCMNRGEVIGRVIVIVVIHKITRSRLLGVLASGSTVTMSKMAKKG